MNIYLYVDSDELEEIAAPLARDIAAWLADNAGKASFVDRGGESSAEAGQVAERDLGLEMETNRRADLKAPLAFLYGLAREYQCDFVVGFYDPQTGRPENVCFFGHEEGRPDHFEIASYLGLKR